MPTLKAHPNFYFVIDIQHLITLVKNNIFQRNVAITSEIYWGLSVRNIIQINSDWALCDV